MTFAGRVVGQSVRLREAPDRVTGRAIYTQDLVLPGMLWGAILRSPHPHAVIRAIDVSAALAVPGVVATLTGEQTGDKYLNYGPAFADRYPLARGRVRFAGEEVAAVAAETLAQACAAAAAIRVDYQVLPAVFDPAAALAPDAPQLLHGPNLPWNVAQHSSADWGGVAAGFAAAAHIVEGHFEHGLVAPVCLETNGVVAAWDDAAGTMDLWAGTQAPFFVRKEVAHLLGVQREQVRVRSIHIGGGFGGKSQAPEPIGICALLARKAGRPVKITLTRREEFLAGKTDHGKVMHLRSAAAADGTLLARHADYLVDNGAFTHMGPAYVSAVRQRTANLYRVKAAGFDGRLVYTNKVPGGSYRGMGAPQIIWAIETQVDELAERLGKDPLRYRQEIANQPGDVTPQGFQISTCPLVECLEEAGRRIGWECKRANPKPWRGVGIAAMINPSVGVLYPEGNFANVALTLRADGTFLLATQAADCGTWQNTVLAQFAAEELDATIERIDVLHMDTDQAPDDLGSAASRVTFVTGGAAIDAGLRMKAEVATGLAKHWGVLAEAVEFAGDGVGLRGANARRLDWPAVAALLGEIRVQGHHVIDLPRADPKTGYGHYAATYGFGAQAAEVEVDSGTGQVRVLKVVVVQDMGRVINPAALVGQMQGGIVQGIGMALSEELVLQDGAPVNTSMITYRVPRIFESTEIDCAFIEQPDATGPYGAKAGGEHSINPTVAAIANAVAHATGIRFRRIPITPHRMLDALRRKRARQLDLQPWRRPYNLEVAVVRRLYPAIVFPVLKTLGRSFARERPRVVEFDHERPRDLASAIAALQRPGRRAKLIAGGTDLLVGIRQGIYGPDVVVDIAGLKELTGIDVGGDRVRIGAGSTLAAITEHAVLREALPALAEGLDLVATQQIRNVATLAGDLCQEKRCWFFRAALPCYKSGGAACPCYAITGDNRHHSVMGAGRCAAPCVADAAPILVALDGTVIVTDGHRERSIPMERFYRWSGETVLAPGEVMLAVEIPSAAAGQAYEKFGQWRGDFPEASAAVRLRRLDAARVEARISLGGVAPLPMRPKAAEATLLREGLGDAALRAAAEKVVLGALPLRDNAAKLDMIVAVTERALRRARDRI